jgi:hypothetical protein
MTSVCKTCASLFLITYDRESTDYCSRDCREVATMGVTPKVEAPDYNNMKAWGVESTF